MDYIERLDITEGLNIIRTAIEQETEDKMFFRWSVGYQAEISYQEFKEKLVAGNYGQQETNVLDTLKKVKEIAAMQRGGGKDGDI